MFDSLKEIVVPSCDLPVEKNENRSVNTHIKTTRMKKRLGKEVSTAFPIIYVIKVEENIKASYKGHADFAIQSMQAPPVSIVFPV